MRTDGDPKPGEERYVLERMADPLERFTVVRPCDDAEPGGAMWVMRSSLGNEVVVSGGTSRSCRRTGYTVRCGRGNDHLPPWVALLLRSLAVGIMWSWRTGSLE